VHPSIAVYLRLVCILAVTTAAAPKSWVIRLDGAGPVKVGMTLAQLNATLKEDFTIPTDEDEQACFYAETARHPGIAFMIEHGRVTRVDVRERGLATVAGVRVGDPEALVMKVYGKDSR